jgi:hypothetical protein
MTTTCYICKRTESRDLQINDCDLCERSVCGNCAEVDYDAIGDPLTFVNTQWICDSFKGGCRAAEQQEVA